MLREVVRVEWEREKVTLSHLGARGIRCQLADVVAPLSGAPFSGSCLRRIGIAHVSFPVPPALRGLQPVFGTASLCPVCPASLSSLEFRFRKGWPRVDEARLEGEAA